MKIYRPPEEKSILSFFDFSTNMVKPWAENGYTCYCIDIKHPAGFIKCSKNIYTVGIDILKWPTSTFTDKTDISNVTICFFFPPCTDVAVSGARWFKDKGLGALIGALGLFKKSIDIAEYYKVPYMIENPVSTVSTYWRKPDFTFQPWNFGDLYSKKTCLWTGNDFKMPSFTYTIKPEGVTEDIWKMPPSKDRAEKRSITPIGFAKAIFEANHIQ